MAIFKGLGLIDVFFLILCLRISYAAASKGAVIEILKVIALVFNCVFTFQFYPFIAEGALKRLPFLTKDFITLGVFCALFLITGIVLGLLIKLIDALFKRESIPRQEKFLALATGFIRFIFLASMFTFLFYLIPLPPEFLSRGFSLKIFKQPAPKIYLVSAGIYNKFSPKLSVNAQVKKYLDDDIANLR